MHDALIKKIADSDTDRIKFAITDTDGILRGKMISKEKFLKIAKDGLGMCNVIFGWDSNDGIYDHKAITGWHTGYPDSMATLDLETVRYIPWDQNVPFFLADFYNSEELGPVCPRTILRKTAEKAKDMGFHPVYASEYEWYHFGETPEALEERGFTDVKALTPGMFGYSMLRMNQYSDFYNDLFTGLKSAGIPLMALHTETGNGACEAGIMHDHILEAADRSVQFKNSVKEISALHGITASFMAKWSEDLPGSGAHIHQSLWDLDRKRNLFTSDIKGNNAQIDPDSLLGNFIAGQLHCLPALMPIYAPTINSYKRLTEGSWAATTVSWGIDNRTTALRVISGEEADFRVENRVPGADTNPYLVMAASLASGLYGIENKLSLSTEITSGNEYESNGRVPLPTSLKDAIRVMQESELPAKLFGEAFTDNFIKSRLWECRLHEKAVTTWELKRYFEII